MSWVTSTDLTRYEKAAGAFVRSRPVEHTVLLSVAERVRRQGAGSFGDRPPVFGWWSGPDGRVAAAFLRTPPHSVLLTDLPARAAGPLAECLADLDPALPGATGPADAVRALSAAWQARTGAEASPREEQRLYRLGELTPTVPPGQAGREARAADRRLLADWLRAFHRAIDAPEPQAELAVDYRLDYRGWALWEDSGTPVSMAGRTPVLHGVARIGPVYTPPVLRRRGYAGAVTALLCRAALADGARELVLFTDLANPTSNALYQRLGFRPLRDHRTVVFSPAAAS